MIYVKVHEKVVAMCDEDLIGKKFEDDTRQLEVSEHFFKGDLKSEEEVVLIMKEASNLNLVGNNVVRLAVKEGIVHENEIIEVQGVKHAQRYMLK